MEKKLHAQATLTEVSRNELKESYQSMLDMAIAQLNMAYAPYSNFHVGAAVLLENEEIFGGSNQENASYPLCMCGERTALYHAHAIYKDVAVKAIAITARNEVKKISRPVMPCGACRQVIVEYEIRHQQLIELFFITDEGKIYKADSGAAILPFGFDGSFLE